MESCDDLPCRALEFGEDARCEAGREGGLDISPSRARYRGDLHALTDEQVQHGTGKSGGSERAANCGIPGVFDVYGAQCGHRVGDDRGRVPALGNRGADQCRQ